MSAGGRDFSAPLPAFRGYLCMMQGHGKGAATKKMPRDTENGKAAPGESSVNIRAACKSLIDRAFAELEGNTWGLTPDNLEVALTRSVVNRFGASATSSQIEKY